MNLARKIISKLNGLRYPQEYLCLSRESFEQPLQLYLSSKGTIFKNITDEHVFAGYSPLLFSLSSPDPSSLPADIEIIFAVQPPDPNVFPLEKDAIARLALKKIKTQEAEGQFVAWYEGIHGAHRFQSSFQQQILSLENKLFKKKPGNVFLPGNLYKQVQIAYAFPRLISLITVGQAPFFNLFPTDLHGPLPSGLYVDSLRHEGKAAAQVMSTGRMLLTEVQSSHYKTVYALGKNHMQDMKTAEHFPFSNQLSDNFKLPVPNSAIFCRELELLDSFKHGIHRLMLFNTVSARQYATGDRLAHVHNVYASWRYNNGLRGNYLMR